MSSDASGIYRKTSAAGYVLDQTSNAVINTDENEYARFLAERQKAKSDAQLKQRVETLEIAVRELTKQIERLNGKATTNR